MKNPLCLLPLKKESARFTMIELMLVISIIAILASLLLPALQKGQEAARKSKCTSNLKQVGMSVSLYFADFDDYYAPNIVQMPGIMDKLYLVQINTKDPNYLYSKVWDCPSNPSPTGTSGTSKYFYYKRYSYIANKDFGSSINARLKSHMVVHPSRKVFITERNIYYNSGSPSGTDVLQCNYSGLVCMPGVHNSWANILFADQHVDMKNGKHTDYFGSNYTKLRKNWLPRDQ